MLILKVTSNLYKMKNKFSLISGSLLVIYFIYAINFCLTAIFGEILFTWQTAIKLLAPLVILSSIFLYFFKKEEWAIKMIQKKLFVLYGSVLLVSLWIIGPIENYLLMDVSGKNIAIQIFSYLWETLVFGGLAIIIFNKMFKPIHNFLRNYESKVENITNEEVLKVSDLVARFPLQTASIAPIISILGYIIGSIQFYIVNPSIHTLIIVNNSLISLAIIPIQFLIIYFFTRYILNDVNNVLYTFGDITLPKKVLGINEKIILLSISYSIFFVPLFAGSLLNLTNNLISINKFHAGLWVNLFIAFIIMFLVGKAISKDLIHSLSEIKRGLQIIQECKCNAKYKINIKTGDEVEDLAHEFNKSVNRY